MKNVRLIGLDVHAQTISVAVAEPSGGKVRSLGMIVNRMESVRKLIRKLGSPGQLRACYEAGPTGYALYGQWVQRGVKCEGIAPTLMPMKPGDRVKTDRRDAERLARSDRAGDLTAVWVPDPAHEALRDLVHARGASPPPGSRSRESNPSHSWPRPAPHRHPPCGPLPVRRPRLDDPRRYPVRSRRPV